MSLMGIYQSDLAVNTASFPATLPKISVHFFIITPIKKEIKTLKVWLKWASKHEIVRAESSGKISVPELLKTDDAKRFTLGVTIAVTPFEISEEDFLEAWVDVDGESERAGRVKVHRNTEPGS